MSNILDLLRPRDLDDRMLGHEPADNETVYLKLSGSELRNIRASLHPTQCSAGSELVGAKLGCWCYENPNLAARTIEGLRSAAQQAPMWPSDGKMLELLTLAGFDPQSAHPSCYYAFSWKTFTEGLKAYTLTSTQSESGSPVGWGGHLPGKIEP